MDSKQINPNSKVFNCIIYKYNVKITTQVIYDEEIKKEREISTLMIFHEYDNKAIYLTLPFCYDLDEDLSNYFGSSYHKVIEFKNKKSKKLLKMIKQIIDKNSESKPE